MPADPATEPPVQYEIRVRGVLGDGWAAWFDDMRIASDEYGDTTITGSVADQAALHGLIAKIRDLGLELLGLRRTDAD